MNKQKRKIKFLKLSTLIVFLAITFLSLKPPLKIDIDMLINDKIGHAFAYCILMIHLGLLSDKKKWIKMAFFCLLYSALLEIIQYFVPGRTSELADLLANATGILIGIIILYLFKSSLIRVVNTK